MIDSNSPVYSTSLYIKEEVIQAELSHRNGEDHLKIEVALKVIGRKAYEYAILTQFDKEQYDEHVAEIMEAIRENGFEREFN